MKCYSWGPRHLDAELRREFVETVLRQSNSVWGWSQWGLLAIQVDRIVSQSLYKPVALHVFCSNCSQRLRFLFTFVLKQSILSDRSVPCLRCATTCRFRVAAELVEIHGHCLCIAGRRIDQDQLRVDDGYGTSISNAWPNEKRSGSKAETGLDDASV